MKPTKEELIRIAKQHYLSAAVPDNDFTPMPYADIEAVMREAGYAVSKSSIQRWATAASPTWREELDVSINQLIAASSDARDKVAKRATDATMRQTGVDIETNAEVLAMGYTVIRAKLEGIVALIKDGKSVSDKNAKLAIDIVKLTADREDRMLDRQAAMQVAQMMSAEDALARLEATDIEIEEEEILDEETRAAIEAMDAVIDDDEETFA